VQLYFGWLRCCIYLLLITLQYIVESGYHFVLKRSTPATHCNALHRSIHQQIQMTLQHTATHCNTLQHTATHCNILQHTATHCTTLFVPLKLLLHLGITLKIMLHLNRAAFYPFDHVREECCSYRHTADTLQTYCVLIMFVKSVALRIHTDHVREERCSVSAVCLQCVAVCSRCIHYFEDYVDADDVASINLQVSFAEYSLFYRALLQKRPII